MGIRALKATPQYAAFRRWRARFRERLRRLGRKLDAWTGARRLQRATLSALVASDETQLQVLTALVKQLREAGEARERDQQAVLTAIDHTAQRVETLERDVRADTQARTAAAALRGDDAERVLETTTRTLLEPELDLLAHLAPLLPARVAVDVGANTGDLTAALARAGLKVHAFEPNPPVARALAERFAGQRVVVHAEALSAWEGETELHLVEDRSADQRYGEASVWASLQQHRMPEGLVFAGAVKVPVRRLDQLHARGELPPHVGLVKIDTEGQDLQVIQGMGDRRYPVVMTEFWDRELVLARDGSGNQLPDLVYEMRERGYANHLVIFRIWTDARIAYYCNMSDSVESSWGNVLFFRDRALFESARLFCEASLVRATFRPHWPPRPLR